VHYREPIIQKNSIASQTTKKNDDQLTVSLRQKFSCINASRIAGSCAKAIAISNNPITCAPLDVIVHAGPTKVSARSAMRGGPHSRGAD
jgi:hypothetical protein